MCETRIFMHTFNLNSISQMKKKIFSALLMGVFTLASMSMFVSCKDYDDDINNLDAGQQELLSRLEALEGDVNTKYTDLSGQLATAVENANKALQGSNEALAALEEVRTTASAAGTAAANAQTTADGAQEAAEAAQKTADEALQKAEDALKAIGVDESGVSLVEKVADLENRVASLEALKETIPTLIEQAQKATNEQLKALNEQVAKYEAFFDNLFAMLTGVELYGTFTGSEFNTGNLSALLMDMMYGNVKVDSKFGDNEAYTTASPEITYTKGADIKNPSGIIVRVNPLNANIDGDNVAIKLINSKGEDMSKYVEVAGVEPFNELLTRAGAQSESGLYKINFQFVDGADINAFAKAISATVEGAAKKVLFAVAINNTDTVQDDRYVASTFDLTLAGHEYEPSRDLTYTVSGVNGEQKLKSIKNRVKPDGTAIDDNGRPLAGNPQEYTWIDYDAKNPTPATAISANNGNVKVDVNDRRANEAYVAVEVGKPFTVALDDQNGVIDHYYVVLDKDFAGESAPSEWNAWTSYSYTGLQTMTDADKKLDITINSESALGDHIGFRVFAVNRDGTLVDPDGKAFYVAVGNATTVTTVDVTFNAWDADHRTNGVIKALPSTFEPVSGSKTVSGVVEQEAFDEDGVKSASGAKITWTLLGKNKNAITNWKDAKFIKIELNDVQNFLDDATFSFVIEDKVRDNAGALIGYVDRVVNTINVNVTKAMPTAELTKFSFKENQLVNGVYTCYLDATAWEAPVWNATYSETTVGEKSLWNFVTGLDNDPAKKDGESVDFIFSFANAKYNAITKDYTDAEVVTTATPKVYALSLPQVLIDGETQHATQISRNYPDISYRYNAQAGGNVRETNYVVDLLTCNTIFACPISKTTYDWKKVGNPNNKDKDDNPIPETPNWIVYNATYPAWFGDNFEIAKAISADNSVDNRLYTVDKTWNNKFYAAGTISAKLISNGTQEEDYFKVEVSDGGNFIFHQVSGATNPVSDVASTLVITAKDAYGHTYTYNLPFTVKKRLQ